MIAVAVDDEPLMLYALAKAVKASPDITSVTEFSSGDDTLRWVQDNPVDVAFLDIDMRGMDGLTLAESMLNLPSSSMIYGLVCPALTNVTSSVLRSRTHINAVTNILDLLLLQS